MAITQLDALYGLELFKYNDFSPNVFYTSDYNTRIVKEGDNLFSQISTLTPFTVLEVGVKKITISNIVYQAASIPTYTFDIAFYSNNTKLFEFTTRFARGDKLMIGFAIDDTEETAAYCDLTYIRSYEEMALAGSTGGGLRWRSDLYTFLEELIPPAHTWKSWDYLIGNAGQYRCNLTMLKNDSIGNFSTFVPAFEEDFSRISNESSIWNYYQNSELDAENIIAWSGINWLTLTCSEVVGQPNEVKFTFKFYIKGVSETIPVYTYEEVILFQGTTPTRNYYLSFVHDDENQAAVFLPIKYMPTVVLSPYGYGNTSPTDNEMLYLWQWLQSSNAGEPEYPYDTGTTDNGGNPTIDSLPNDLMPTVTTPTLAGTLSGLFTIYCPDDSDLANIATFLWSDNVIDNFKKYFNNFSDNIIALYVLPYKPSNLPTKAFKVGRVVSDTITSVEYVTTRFVTIDMGEITIGGCWDSYLDFSPYTKFNVYLPGIGIEALDADDILAPLDKNKNFGEELGCTLSLQYNLDLMTGIVVAYVKINGQIRYQFSGKIGYSIPLTGETHRTLLQGFAMATAGAIGTIASGGTAAPFAAAAASAAIINAMKPDVYRGSNLSGDAASLCYETPYLIRRVPNKPQLVNQDRFTGFQSYKTGLLSEFSGYTEVEEVHAEGFVCTEEEREEIIELLKKGVIL